MKRLIQKLRPWVAVIENGPMSLYVDYDPRRLNDYYMLYGAKSALPILVVCIPKISLGYNLAIRRQ